MFASESAMAAVEKIGTFITDALTEPLERFKSVLTQVTSVITPFVDAIAPGTVQAFQQAMQDLNATIGSGLIGSLQVFTSVVREVSGAVLPLMQKLEPILTSLANSLGTVLVNSIRVMVDWITDSVALFKILAQVLETITGLFEEFTAVAGALIRTFTALVSQLLGGGNGIKRVLDFFVDVIHQATKALVMFTTGLVTVVGVIGDMIGSLVQSVQTFFSALKVLFGGSMPGAGAPGSEKSGLEMALGLLTDVIHSLTNVVQMLTMAVANLLAVAGLKDVLKTFADALDAQIAEREKRAPGLVAAARNPQFTDIGAIMRQQQLAAFNAAGGAGARAPVSEKDFLKDIANSVRGIAYTKKSFYEALTEWWDKDVFRDGTPLRQAVAEVLRLGDRAARIVSDGLQTVQNWFTGLTNAIRNIKF